MKIGTWSFIISTKDDGKCNKFRERNRLNIQSVSLMLVTAPDLCRDAFIAIEVSSTSILSWGRQNETIAFCASHWSLLEYSAQTWEIMFHVHGLATNLGQHRCHIVFIGFSLILLRVRCCSLQASCMIHLMFLFYSFCVQLNSYIIPILHITFRWCVRCVCVYNIRPRIYWVNYEKP